MTTFRGPWTDTARAAETTALDAVNVTVADYVEVRYSDGMHLEPIDGKQFAIDVEVRYSEPRDQYRAILRKLSPTEVIS